MKRKSKIVKEFNSQIKLIRKSPKEGLRAFYCTHARYITGKIRSILKDERDVEEAINEVLYRVWRFSQNPTQVEFPFAWLSEIVRNCAIDKTTKAQRRGDIKEIAITYEIDYSEINFYDVLSILREEEQFIIIMKLVYEYSFGMIAKELNKPRSTVTTSYYRALEKLKSQNGGGANENKRI